MSTQRSTQVRRSRVAGIVYGLAMAGLIVPRLHSGSALWLDEALSVNIARLPVPNLLEALRHDGSPPLYYLLLHCWMAVFGTGDGAVRALSTVFSLAALPVAYAIGRRLGGPRVAASAMLVVAASPFAIRYATETRMYALVMLLALAAVLLALRALEAPTAARLAAVAVVVGLLSLTHYWTLFFLAAGELLLIVRAHREQGRGPSTRLALTVPLGGLLFLPWLPSFLFQSAHTGTPWRTAPRWTDLSSTLLRWNGPGPIAVALASVLAVAVVLALRDHAGRQLLAVGLGGLVLGLVACRVQGAGFSLRYSIPLAAPVLLAAGIGAAGLRQRQRHVLWAAVVLLSLAVAAFSPLLGTRTQSRVTAAVLRAGLGPGDVVVYCPDQLGPAVDRLLPSGVRQVVYPTMGPPQRIDWVDYAARNAAASPGDFAASVAAQTPGTVWLVRVDGYLTFGDQCAQVDQDFATLRGNRTVRHTPSGGTDSAYVVGYDPPGQP